MAVVSGGPGGRQVLYSFLQCFHCVFHILLKISTAFMLVFLLVLIPPTPLSPFPFCCEHALMFSCLWIALRYCSSMQKHESLSPPRGKAKLFRRRWWTKWRHWQVWVLSKLWSWWPCSLSLPRTDPPHIAHSHSLRLSGHALSYGINTVHVRARKGWVFPTVLLPYKQSSIQFKEIHPLSWKFCTM